MALSLLVLILVGLDQWSKWAIQTHMKLYESIPIMPGFFKLFMSRIRSWLQFI